MTDASPEAPSTKARILDAAERLFAARGFDGVSLREITREAKVELALANYHFGPKADLFLAVVARRADELNQARLALFDALPNPPTVDGLIDAFARPYLEKSVRGGPGWKAYARLIAQIANSPRWTRNLMSPHFDHVAVRFVAGMQNALPTAAKSDIFWGFQFMVGSMTMTFAETGRVHALSLGHLRDDDLDAIYQRLVPFLAAGFRALCA
jgi:AcrR family transcriptional regulator